MGTRKKLLCLLIAFCTAVEGGRACGQNITAGFAERDITPRLGMERPGNYFKQFHSALHDPCKVRAVVFEDGRAKAAIVSVDALLIRRPQVEATRAEIEKRTDLQVTVISSPKQDG